MSNPFGEAVFDGSMATYEWPDEATVVNRLRVRSSPTDVIPSKLRAETVLGGASLQPSLLPREWILCIRSLTDPLPGKLELRSNGARLQREWAHAFASRIEELARGAARPICEAVPANAMAVLFADRAEFLASLALDLIGGELVNRWWWHAMLRNACPERLVLIRWLESSECVPKALDHLARRGQIQAFIKTLGDNEIRRLIRQVVLTFSLHRLWPIIVERIVNYKDEESVAMTSLSATQSQGPGITQSRSPTASVLLDTPWRKWVPEGEDRNIDIGRQLLVGVGLMLYRAPSVVRSVSFAQQVSVWIKEKELSRQRTGESTAPIEELATDENELALRGGTQAHDVEKFPAKKDYQICIEPKHDSEITEPAMSAHDTLSPETESRESPSVRSPEIRGRSSQTSSPLLPTKSEYRPGLVISEDEIRTELGGLFYLINIAIHLNLYPDFTSPLDPGLDLPIWDFIELVGRRMIPGKSKRDPVWAFLARLAVRLEGESAGEHFEPPDEWRIPSEWLKPFAGDPVWTWTDDGERLRVFHHEGFCILDIRARTNPERILHDEIERYRKTARFTLRLTKRRPSVVAPLERWTDWLVSYILSLLSLALSVNRKKDAARLLLNRRAHIVASDARLDIRYSLADLPLKIRFAGLDRDPGWVPTGGRFVAFHYV